jgi:hypothetical protein
LPLKADVNNPSKVGNLSHGCHRTQKLPTSMAEQLSVAGLVVRLLNADKAAGGS